MKAGLTDYFFLSSLTWRTNLPGGAGKEQCGPDAADYATTQLLNH
jgi:hypothetical protein